MMGEVRKHFRDKGLGVRVPRSLQENYLALKKARSSLTQSLGREPTMPELAAETGVEPSEIGQIVAAGDSYRSTSLDIEIFKDGVFVGYTLGTSMPPSTASTTTKPSAQPCSHSPERERTILLYRFFGEMIQTEIAAKVGLSQMHVSRLLSQSLKALRRELGNSHLLKR
ncbi:sigma-70 domain-containing protein [Rhodococcus sp. IEGM 1318]|uniref:sigma-70 domain-containing protein n=1 Tax=Rhodococcus sp. IEGM 1318 TaxID=3082226 RepID=UPI002955CB80|nr:sigma-70 domain-containing protein [Rhodococcus sp. IEGM 1318]MDV8009210.1 sigma-70 domain-containing protein [Rhodococcus sp. IEGM 1318]